MSKRRISSGSSTPGFRPGHGLNFDNNPIKGETTIGDDVSEDLSAEDIQNIAYTNAKAKTEGRKASLFLVLKFIAAVIGVVVPTVAGFFIYYLSNITGPVATMVNEINNLKEVNKEININFKALDAKIDTLEKIFKATLFK